MSDAQSRPDKEQSSIADAFGTTARMNMALTRADYAAESLDAFGWYQALRTLNRELRSEMKDKDAEAVDKLFAEIKPHLDRWFRLSKGRGVMDAKLYDLLDDVEILLRQVHDEAGYKTFRRDDPRFAR